MLCFPLNSCACLSALLCTAGMLWGTSHALTFFQPRTQSGPQLLVLLLCSSFVVMQLCTAFSQVSNQGLSFCTALMSNHGPKLSLSSALLCTAPCPFMCLCRAQVFQSRMLPFLFWLIFSTSLMPPKDSPISDTEIALASLASLVQNQNAAEQVVDLSSDQPAPVFLIPEDVPSPAETAAPAPPTVIDVDHALPICPANALPEVPACSEGAVDTAAPLSLAPSVPTQQPAVQEGAVEPATPLLSTQQDAPGIAPADVALSSEGAVDAAAPLFPLLSSPPQQLAAPEGAVEPAAPLLPSAQQDAPGIAPADLALSSEGAVDAAAPLFPLLSSPAQQLAAAEGAVESAAPLLQPQLPQANALATAKPSPEPAPCAQVSVPPQQHEQTALTGPTLKQPATPPLLLPMSARAHFFSKALPPHTPRDALVDTISDFSDDENRYSPTSASCKTAPNISLRGPSPKWQPPPTRTALQPPPPPAERPTSKRRVCTAPSVAALMHPPPRHAKPSPFPSIFYPAPPPHTGAPPPVLPKHSPKPQAMHGLPAPAPRPTPRSLSRTPPPQVPRLNASGAWLEKLRQHSAPPTPSPQAYRSMPHPRAVPCATSRRKIKGRTLACQTAWFALLQALGPASKLFATFQHHQHAQHHWSVAIAPFTPGTLERYFKVAWNLVHMLQAKGQPATEISLDTLADFFRAAHSSHKEDLDLHRCSATMAVKSARWLAKHSQWEALQLAMQAPLVSAYAARNFASDRKEALPVPLMLVMQWEARVCHPNTPRTTRLLLGAALLCIHASLRFGDSQRIDLHSLSLSAQALHGTCFATKTSKHGQPFALAWHGLHGRDKASSWILHWLAELAQLADDFFSPTDPIDFMWPSTSPELHSIPSLAPASYCTALLFIRWAATLPWLPHGQGLLPQEAESLTVHSLKTTLLASAAQRRLPKEDRLCQGHHRDSAALYSRNDTFASLDIQRDIAHALQQGWRPERSLARGGQAPVPEPPFLAPSTPIPQALSAHDLQAGPWKAFTTRHEALHMNAAKQPPRTSTDQDALEVEQAALERASSSETDWCSSARDSPPPSLSDSEGSNHADPPSTEVKFVCSGPWGVWHTPTALSLDALRKSGSTDLTQLRTCCGVPLGIAAQVTSTKPSSALCRRKACANARTDS